MKGKYREPLIVAAPGLLICPTSFLREVGLLWLNRHNNDYVSNSTLQEMIIYLPKFDFCAVPWLSSGPML